MNNLRQAAQQALEHVQEFKRRWWQVPAFGNKVNKATREAITNAHSPIFELEHALRAALAEQPAEQEPVALGPLAKRRVFDYIRGAYDLGYNDARNARAIPGDNAPGYKGRDVEADHGGALSNALCACITAPQPAIPPWHKLVPVEPTDNMVQAAHHLDLSYMPGQEGADRAAIYRAMLAAAPEATAQEKSNG